MTKNGKRELLEAIRPRYLRASTIEKTHILDEFVAITGYHRKYAIRLLKHGRKQPRREKRGRSKVYQGEVVSALIKVWEVCDRICSRHGCTLFRPRSWPYWSGKGNWCCLRKPKGCCCA
jgi:hypothetical protein